MDKNRGIGADNDLLWQRDLPADLAHFKKMTTGKSIIMGRRTFESIGSKPLPNRQNIVVSRTATGVQGIITAASFEAACAVAQYPVMVIGGGQLYRDTIDLVDTLYVTEVDAEFPQATVYFPEISPDTWQEVSREHHDADEKNAYAFDFVEYARIAQ